MAVTTRATSVVEGREEGIIGRSITAQVGRGRCDQRSWLRIAIFSRCLRSLLSHVTGYPARSRDRSCDRHTATATRPPPHGHRHTATATRQPPHGHRHTATATRQPPHGHRHTATATRPPPHGHRHTATATRSPPRGLATLGRVTCRVTCQVMCRVM